MKSYKELVIRMVEAKLRDAFNEVAVVDKMKQDEHSYSWSGYVGMNHYDGFITSTGNTYYWDNELKDYVEF